MRTIVAILNKPNLNGRIYTRESFIELPEYVFIVFGISECDQINLEKVIGDASKFLIEDDKLTCEVKMLDTPLGRSLNKLYNGYFNDPLYTHVIGGFGNYQESNIVNYKLTHLNLIDRSKSSFENI